MISIPRRDEVIGVIRENVASGQLNAKAEVGDPQLDDAMRAELRRGFLAQYGTTGYRLNNLAARAIADSATALAMRGGRIEGLQNAQGITGGAIITSNHFSPVDSAPVRAAAHKLGKRVLPIVGTEDNLAMTGPIGYLMRYADIIPLSTDHHYLMGEFLAMLKAQTDRGRYVLVYPEQEMWYNYRKPRPCKRGAYLFAAMLGVPVIPCFVEIVDGSRHESADFLETSYVMHVLDPIHPDPALSDRQNSVAMCAQDYRQKVEAYEQAYGKKLDYAFDAWDIAGWVPGGDQAGR